jgi:uncharacterized protein YycO
MIASETNLRPGDCLLYSPKGVFGKIVQLKTWHPISHVEIYRGMGTSWASRDGQGVNSYPWRNTELAYVLRPTQTLYLTNADAWATLQIGTPYGWLELLEFINITHRGKGMFCSEFACYYYRAAGWPMFPLDLPSQIAPFQFTSLIGAGFTNMTFV